MASGNKRDFYHKHPSAGGGNPPTTPVVLYHSIRPSEAAPLLQRGTQRHGISATRALQVAGLCLLALVFSSMVHQTYMHYRYCPPDSAERDAIRQSWEQEASQRNILEREWQLKRREQAEKERNWQFAAGRHEREVKKHEFEEHERQEKVRREWVREIERQEREVKKRELGERERQEKARQEWAREIERHEREFEELRSRERRLRELEQERWRREVEERDRREEEERQKRHMFWGNVQPHACTTYATREYTAQLMNLPTDWRDRLGACKATPLEIHGVSYLPATCEDRGLGVMIGRWEINQREPDCTTFWDSYDDKGCTSPGSGKKYITHKLMNLPENGNWKEFCATTPINFDQMQFPGAQECFTSAWGVYGQWEIDSSKC